MIPKWPRRSASARTRPPTWPTSIASATNLLRRSGRARPPGRLDRRRSRQADQRRAGGVGRCRRGACRPPHRTTVSLSSRSRRRATCSPHCIPTRRSSPITLSNDNGWVFLLHNGADHGIQDRWRRSKQIAGLVHRVRAGIELTTSGLPTFDVADAQKLYQLTIGGVAASLDGVKSLVVAPAGPLLSLPFEVLLTGPASPTISPTRHGWCAGSPSPMFRRRQTLSRCGRSRRGSRATQPWFGFGDFRPVTLAQAEKSSRRRLRRQRQTARRAAAPALCPQGA